MSDRMPREYHIRFERAWRKKVKAVKVTANPDTEPEIFEKLTSEASPGRYIKGLIRKDLGL